MKFMINNRCKKNNKEEHIMKRILSILLLLGYLLIIISSLNITQAQVVEFRTGNNMKG